jgi:hypothetical protein
VHTSRTHTLSTRPELHASRARSRGTPLALTSGMTPSNPIQPSARDRHGLRIRTAVKTGIGPTGTNHGIRLRLRAVPTRTGIKAGGIIIHD